MTEEKKDDGFKWMWIFLAIVVAALMLSSALNNYIEKGYEAALTPEERHDLQEQRDLEKQLNEQAAQDAWDNGLGYDITLTFPVWGWLIILFTLGGFTVCFQLSRARW